jgi:hypothetical protein
MVENLNKKYEYLLKSIKNFNIDVSCIDTMKKYITQLNPKDLLKLCPILTIPKNTIIYHSNKFRCTDLTDELNNLYRSYPYYTQNQDCIGCVIKETHFTEYIGSKPRISEIANNPNSYNYKNGSCTCSTTVQSRLFGNFNFIGNYDIALRRQMRGTQVFITKEDMKLIDTSFMSIELGFSFKRINDFAKTEKYMKYCKENKLDGIIFLDYVDKQIIPEDNNFTFKSACTSCYKMNPNIDMLTQLGIVGANPAEIAQNMFICPEFSLIHEIGIGGALGTSKLVNLGMVDLVNDIKIAEDRHQPLPREVVLGKFNMLFSNYNSEFQRVINHQNNVIISINYETSSIYKIIKLNVDGIEYDFYDSLINVLDMVNHSLFFIKYGDEYDINGNILLYDPNYCVPENGITDINYTTIYGEIEIMSFLKFKKINPFRCNSELYIYSDGNSVYNNASDYLFNTFLSEFFKLDPTQIKQIYIDFWIPCLPENVVWFNEIYEILYICNKDSINSYNEITKHNNYNSLMQGEQTYEQIKYRINDNQRKEDIITKFINPYLYNCLDNQSDKIKTLINRILESSNHLDSLQLFTNYIDAAHTDFNAQLFYFIKNNIIKAFNLIFSSIKNNENFLQQNVEIQTLYNNFIKTLIIKLNTKLQTMGIQTLINQQNGGYKNKYLKYKQKYLELKKHIK